MSTNDCRKNNFGWLIQCRCYGCYKEFKRLNIKTYRAAKEAAKREGWTVSRHGVWYCPDHGG